MTGIPDSGREEHDLDTEVSRGFRYQFPIDPIRLAAGAVSHWRWMLLVVATFILAGVAIGVVANKQQFSISVSMIKRSLPVTLQTSMAGQSFRPTELNHATLVTTLLANEPLDIAAQKAASGLSMDQYRQYVEAEQIEGTDIFSITYHSPFTEADALRFSAIWAQEICDYTKRVQQAEASGAIRLLRKEVEEFTKQIEEVNQAILDYSLKNDFIGGESKVEAILAKLSQIDLELSETRSEAGSYKQQLINLHQQIRKQGKLDLRLREQKSELAGLLSTYTLENPLVKAKLQSIQLAEQQLEEQARDTSDTDLDDYTGTPLGNEIYLQIIGIKNQLLAAEGRAQSLQQSKEECSEQLTRFPSVVSRYQTLIRERDSLIEGLTLMRNRLKEAEIFSSSAPGYWQIYNPPDSREVKASSLAKIPAFAGVGGALLGLGSCLIIGLVLSQRDPRRSALECCVATNAPLMGVAHTDPAGQMDRHSITAIWATGIEPKLKSDLSEQKPCLIWTGGLAAEVEHQLLSAIGRAADEDTGHQLIMVNLNPSSPLENIDSCEMMEFSKRASVEQPMTVYRANALPPKDVRDALGHEITWFAVLEANQASIYEHLRNRQLPISQFGPCHSTIVIESSAKDSSLQLGSHYSIKLAQHFS